jgi:hypothetical protein
MKYDKTHAAVCGLYCPACSVFIATQEDPARLKFLADMGGITPEEMRCNGCRSDKRIPYCDNCKLYPCAQEKGIDFCGECDEYPCDDLKEFQSLAPHRFELWEAHDEIVKIGYAKWMDTLNVKQLILPMILNVDPAGTNQVTNTMKDMARK